jgi:hypothetical protein
MRPQAPLSYGPLFWRAGHEGGLQRGSPANRFVAGISVAPIDVMLLAVHVLHSYHLESVNDQPPQHTGLIGTTIPHGIPVRVTPVRRNTPVAHSV